MDPFLISFASHLRKCQLMNDVLVIIGEALPKKALDVLENERFGRYLSNSANGMGEHVSTIVHSRVLTTDREWLAWRTSRHNINVSGEFAEVNLANVAFNDSGSF